MTLNHHASQKVGAH